MKAARPARDLAVIVRTRQITQCRSVASICNRIAIIPLLPVSGNTCDDAPRNRPNPRASPPRRTGSRGSSPLHAVVSFNPQTPVRRPSAVKPRYDPQRPATAAIEMRGLALTQGDALRLSHVAVSLRYGSDLVGCNFATCRSNLIIILVVVLLSSPSIRSEIP